MRNIHDIELSNGVVLPAGTIEYYGCWKNEETGDIIYELREIRQENLSPDSMILNEIIYGIRKEQMKD